MAAKKKKTVKRRRKKKPEAATAADVKTAVREVMRSESLKEEMWRDAVKEGVETAIWDVAGYGVVAIFLLMVTGIIISSFIFAFLGYIVLGAAFPIP